jgi:hypothetical protein
MAQKKNVRFLTKYKLKNFSSALSQIICANYHKFLHIIFPQMTKCNSIIFINCADDLEYKLEFLIKNMNVEIF